MPIHPLPQFEADLAEDRRIYEKIKPPTSMVVRFGIMKLVGEYPYSGDAKPGCGSKMVVRTHRGVELAEMLTTTCPNAGCSKSVTRQEMLQYIENSGGRDYPFFNQGRVLRVATGDDLNQQARIDAERPRHVMRAREILAGMEPAIPMKIVDAEPILGGEKITFYFTSEDRVDFRDLVSRLAAEHHTRIELRQVGARDEARLVADYERCGQHCCCKQFLKVLKPISMRSAKIQKATLDPLKISGRCGRLMCCLRYEDETYDDLRKRLPKKKVRLKTPEGWGLVMDTQILTQLLLLRLEDSDKDVAFTVEDLGLVDGKQTEEVIAAMVMASPRGVPPIDPASAAPRPAAAAPAGRAGENRPSGGPSRRPDAPGRRPAPPAGDRAGGSTPSGAGGAGGEREGGAGGGGGGGNPPRADRQRDRARDDRKPAPGEPPNQPRQRDDRRGAPGAPGGPAAGQPRRDGPRAAHSAGASGPTRAPRPDQPGPRPDRRPRADDPLSGSPEEAGAPIDDLPLGPEDAQDIGPVADNQNSEAGGSAPPSGERKRRRRRRRRGPGPGGPADGAPPDGGSPGGDGGGSFPPAPPAAPQGPPGPPPSFPES